MLAHGAAYDAASWREQAERLAKEGMAALAFEDTSARSVAEAAWGNEASEEIRCGDVL